MTMAKAAVTGTVYRNAEKRFTSNNVPVSAFVLNIGEKEDILIRVISKRNANDDVVSNFNKGDRVLVEGRLQIATAKMEDGSEKRIFEIDANTVENIGGASTSSVQNNTQEIVKFASEEFADELIGEDEIPF